MRHIFMLVLFMFGTIGNAQSVEEQLTICIEESQDILRYAQAWRKSIEEIGENPSPSEFADLITAPEETETLVTLLGKVMEGSITSADIPTNYEAEAAPVFLRNELIRNMVREAYKGSNEFKEMARYISLCSNNFGGDVVTLEAVNTQLKKQIGELKQRLSSAEANNEFLTERVNKHTSENATLKRENGRLKSQLVPINERIEKIETQHMIEVRTLKRINNKLCEWMEVYNHLDVLEKKVYIYDQFFDLCD